ncbi:MAG: hypothetical protein ACTSSH_00870 [Candidatus Heimdallarchaeota archaeon]
MANTFFRMRYWFIRLIILVTMFPILFFFSSNPLIDFVVFFSSPLSFVMWGFLILGFLALFILCLVNWFSTSKPNLAEVTHIYFLVFISIIGLILLGFAFALNNLLLVLLLGCLITSRILGSVKITNSYDKKEQKIKLKNVICNYVLLFLSIIFLILLIIKADSLFAYFLIITPGLIISNSTLNLILIRTNSSQRNRPFLEAKDITRKDYFGAFVKNTKKVWVKTSESINGILFFSFIAGFGIYVIIIFKGIFSVTTIDEWSSILTILLVIHFLLVGIIAFFEIFIHVPLNRFKKLQHPENNTLLVLNILKAVYKKERISGRKTILASIISSLFLLIGTTFMEFFFNWKGPTSLWDRYGFDGKHVIRFLDVMKTPFLIIIFLFIVIILLIGLFTSGYISKNPISGLFAGLLTSWLFTIWIVLIGLGQHRIFALIITELVVCPILGSLGGFLNWWGRGKPGLKSSKGNVVSDKTKVSEN